MILTNKRVLITGGTGSLGRAILRRARQENWEAHITVYARNETKMAQVHTEFPEVSCVIGDVRDLDWLRNIVRGNQILIHAAALKIVPMSEVNVRETVLTNVLGTINVAQACVEAGVEKAVLTSSDKSLGPTYYGTTKRAGEGIFREANEWGHTSFVSVRYGNVLRSANSLLILLEDQIKQNKPFTITDPRMSRFWLSMRQAIDLILYALENSESGTVTVPHAPAMLVTDVAKTLDPDREQIMIGVRAGERLHETLVVREESQHTVDIGNYFVVYSPKDHIQSNLPFQYEYISNKPSHWLTSDELKGLL